MVQSITYEDLIEFTEIQYEDTSFDHEHGTEECGYWWGETDLFNEDIKEFIGSTHVFTKVDSKGYEIEVPMRLTEDYIWLEVE